MTAKDVKDAVFALVVRHLPLRLGRDSLFLSPEASAVLDMDDIRLAVEVDPSLHGLDMRIREGVPMTAIQPRTPEWYAARADAITSTDIPIILGLSAVQVGSLPRPREAGHAGPGGARRQAGADAPPRPVARGHHPRRGRDSNTGSNSAASTGSSPTRRCRGPGRRSTSSGSASGPSSRPSRPAPARWERRAAAGRGGPSPLADGRGGLPARPRRRPAPRLRTAVLRRGA